MLDILGHLDTLLLSLVQSQGPLAYGLLFLIMFAETGLVVFPMLPGDSLLFVVGAVSASGGLDVLAVIPLLILAGILGNWVNFSVGRWVGPHLFTGRRARWLNPSYLQKTHAFYEKHGGKTVVLARFIPIIRTYAPFAAGLGTMSSIKFQLYSALGATLWVTLFVGAGYFFGDLPMIKGRLSLITLGIVVVTVVPALISLLRAQKR